MRAYLLFVLLARVLGAISAFFLSVSAARSFGPLGAGVFLLALNITTFLALGARLGLDNLALKYLIILQSQKSGLAARALLLKAVAAVALAGVAIGLVVVAAIALGLADWIGKHDVGPILIAFSPTVAAMAVIGVVAAGLQSIGRTLSSIAVQSILINLAVSSMILLGGSSAVLSAALYSSVAVIFAGGGLVVLLRLIPKSSSAAPLPEWSELMDSARSFWSVIVLQQLIAWNGQFTASVLLDRSALSVLLVAQQASMLISIVLTAINMVYAPRFAILHANRKTDELVLVLRHVMKTMSIATAPLILFFLMWPNLTLSIFGRGFDAGSTALRILILGQGVNALTGPVGYVLMMTGNERVYRNIFLIVTPCSAAVSIIFGSFWGLDGIALSTALSIASVNVLASIAVARKIGVGFFVTN
ncbi:MAG: hypothetical protein GC186_19250 [Rhodobacteraceae bacterium]|nr:hypothetical protein [Paracoccaceae bacterium]